MRSPFDRLVAWAASRLGYVHQTKLWDVEAKLLTRDADCRGAASMVNTLQLKLAETRADLAASEGANVRLTRMADEVLNARADSLRYGIPLSHVFEMTARRDLAPNTTGEVHTLTIRPKHVAISWSLDRFVLADVQAAPEIAARRAFRELMPAFERSLAMAFATAESHPY